MPLDAASGPPDPAEAAASRLVRRIQLSAREFERRFDAWLAEHGLNLTRAEVLACLAAHGEAGCSQTDLAAALRLSESNVCTLIERMRGDGWLFRLRSDVDRRRSVVVLSPHGMKTIAQIEELRRRRARHWLRGLPSDSLEQLNQLLDQLLLELRRDVDAVAIPPAAVEKPLRRAS
jgi:DNA-binding MarR family transcriptional regulator